MLMYKDYMLRGGFSRKCHSYCLHHRKQNLLTLTHVQHGRSTKGIKTFHVVLQCNPGGYEYLGTATLTTLTKELCPVKCKTRRRRSMLSRTKEFGVMYKGANCTFWVHRQLPSEQRKSSDPPKFINY